MFSSPYNKSIYKEKKSENKYIYKLIGQKGILIDVYIKSKINL